MIVTRKDLARVNQKLAKEREIGPPRTFSNETNAARRIVLRDACEARRVMQQARAFAEESKLEISISGLIAGTLDRLETLIGITNAEISDSTRAPGHAYAWSDSEWSHLRMMAAQYFSCSWRGNHVAPDSEEHCAACCLVKHSLFVDGKPDVGGWVRFYIQNGRPVSPEELTSALNGEGQSSMGYAKALARDLASAGINDPRF